MLHENIHPAANTAVFLNSGPYLGQDFYVEDWWDRVAGKSWMNCNGNPACLDYAVSSGSSTPIDNEVVYGKIGGMGVLVHQSWISENTASDPILSLASAKS